MKCLMRDGEEASYEIDQSTWGLGDTAVQGFIFKFSMFSCARVGKSGVLVSVMLRLFFMMLA